MLTHTCYIKWWDIFCIYFLFHWTLFFGTPCTFGMYLIEVGLTRYQMLLLSSIPVNFEMKYVASSRRSAIQKLKHINRTHTHPPFTQCEYSYLYEALNIMTNVLYKCYVHGNAGYLFYFLNVHCKMNCQRSWLHKNHAVAIVFIVPYDKAHHTCGADIRLMYIFSGELSLCELTAIPLHCIG